MLEHDAAGSSAGFGEGKKAWSKVKHYYHQWFDTAFLPVTEPASTSPLLSPHPHPSAPSTLPFCSSSSPLTPPPPSGIIFGFGGKLHQLSSFNWSQKRMTRISLALAILLLSIVSVTLCAPWPRFLDYLKESRGFTAPRPSDHEDPFKTANLAEFDSTSWTLKTKKFIPNTFQVEPYVANGYHGSRLTAEGVGYWEIAKETGQNSRPVQGWPLDNPRQTFATITGFWDWQKKTSRTNDHDPDLIENGESVVSGIPIWSSLAVATADGRHVYAPGVPKEQIEDYSQELSMRDGILSTTVTWRPVKDGPAYRLTFTVLAHQTRINLGMVRVDIDAVDGNTDLIITDILDGAGAQRTSHLNKSFETNENMIWTSFNPLNVKNVTGYEFSTVDFAFHKGAKLVEGSRLNAESRSWVSKNESTIAQEYTVRGQTMSVLKYVGIASSESFPDAKLIAQKTALKAKKDGWAKLVEEHRAGWDALWDDADIIIPGKNMETLQISIRASLFHLLSNVRSGDEGKGIGDNSVSVCGLTSDCYGGLVFWDADLWMFPGLLSLHPKRAASITNYRQRLLPQAKLNTQKYYNHTDAAMFPWTSSRYGKCTGTGPCKNYQYHLNTDIALSHWHQFLAGGDLNWLKEKGWPVIRAVANMWTLVAKLSETNGDDGLRKGMYVVEDMTDPDEYANHINNGAFTNGGVKRIMGIAREAASEINETPSEMWKEIEENMFIPFNQHAQIIPEYANMNGSVEIKQADVILLNYPLEFKLNDTQARNDLAFYSDAQSDDGPAMTYVMNGIGALNLDQVGCASWTYTLKSIFSFVREPYFQCSEQQLDDFDINGGTNPAFMFLTGHGGILQLPIQGFAGYRPRKDAFYLDPSIPPQIEQGITIKGMKYHNAVFDVNITLNVTTIVYRHSTDGKPINVQIADQNKMEGPHKRKLHPGEVFKVPTRRADINGSSIPGNQAECKVVHTNTPFVRGQYPEGAVDGNNQTRWRPNTPDPAELIVDLANPTNIKKLSMNWAKHPPLKFVLMASNSEGPVKDWHEVYRDENVKISHPWVKEEALEVRLRHGNVTDVVLAANKQTKARWVKLIIEGSRSDDGLGGSVAQVGILSQ